MGGISVGSVIGQFADYFAAVVLAATGAWMLRPSADGDDAEEQKVRLLDSARGWALLLLGVSISLDELAIGFGVGLLRLPLLVLVVLIAAQALFASQLGMRLGARIAERAIESAERIAGLLLVGAGVLVVIEKLSGL